MSNDRATPIRGGRRRPRVVFVGMRCAFSVPPLEALLRAPVEVAAIVLAGHRDGPALIRRVPGAGTASNRVGGISPDADLFLAAGVPVLTVNGFRDPAVSAAIQAFAPDAIAVVCFPWHVPGRIRTIPRLGALNVHPSLLPRGRGPEPLFWAFKRGEHETGTTVHLMDDGLDTGPILRQERLPIPDGIDGAELERRLAVLGGRLLVEAIAGLVAGTISPSPQADASATAAPFPTDEDLIVTTHQPAARAFNLIRGIAPLYGPLTLQIAATGEHIAIAGALALDPAGVLDRAVMEDGDTLRVRFEPGVLALQRWRAPRAAGVASLTQPRPV
jgi:methionyl-tRNA formyltransferase